MSPLYFTTSWINYGTISLWGLWNICCWVLRNNQLRNPSFLYIFPSVPCLLLIWAIFSVFSHQFLGSYCLRLFDIISSIVNLDYPLSFVYGYRYKYIWLACRTHRHGSWYNYMAFQAVILSLMKLYCKLLCLAGLLSLMKVL